MKFVIYPQSFALKPLILTGYLLILITAYIESKLWAQTYFRTLFQNTNSSKMLESLSLAFLCTIFTFLIITYLLDLNLKAQWIRPKNYDFWGIVIFITTAILAVSGLTMNALVPGFIIISTSSIAGLYFQNLFQTQTSAFGFLVDSWIINGVALSGLFILTLLSSKRADRLKLSDRPNH